MKPTITEIKKLLPSSYHEDEIHEVDITGEDMILVFKLRIRGFFANIYRSKRIKKTVFALIMLASAGDGFFYIQELPAHEKTAVIQQINKPDDWMESVVKFNSLENRDKFVRLGSFGSPSPIDPTYEVPLTSAYAPITGSAQIMTGNFNYIPYNSSGSNQS